MGTIARLYKDFGGEVFMLGKPNENIYIEATRNIKEIKKSKILAIGDSAYHDIEGALKFGIDSLLITSTGIHHNLFDDKNPSWDSSQKILANIKEKPKFICSEFVF